MTLTQTPLPVTLALALIAARDRNRLKTKRPLMLQHRYSVRAGARGLFLPVKQSGFRGAQIRKRNHVMRRKSSGWTAAGSLDSSQGNWSMTIIIRVRKCIVLPISSYAIASRRAALPSTPSFHKKTGATAPDRFSFAVCRLTRPDVRISQSVRIVPTHSASPVPRASANYTSHSQMRTSTENSSRRSA